MKSTLTTLTDLIIDAQSAALEMIAAHTNMTGAEDSDEAADLLRDRLEECIRTAKEAQIATRELRKLYEEIKG